MLGYLNKKIPITLISLDNDHSGRTMTERLLNQLSNSIAWPIAAKYGKDPGEAWKIMNIRTWIKSGIKNYPSLGKVI